MIDPDFWKNKRVFMTGHSGFKGGWLALWLEEMGAIVRGYSLPAPTEPSIFEAAKVRQGCSRKRVTFVTSSICGKP